MSLDGTYTGLKASVADWLVRTDLAAAIPDFITLAEAQMGRRFVTAMRKGDSYPRRIVERSDASITTSTEFLAVPSDFMGPLTFIITPSGGDPLELAYLEYPTFIKQKTAKAAQGAYYTGAPKWYTVVNGEFQLYPVADQAYSAELTYLLRFPALSNSNATNWILTNYPDAYLYGALTASAPYLKDDARVTTWGTLFQTAVEDICNADPMPGDKSVLTTELAALAYPWARSGRYDINTDS